MTIENTTKMAFQAAIAITFAELISMTFQFERGYWITLSAMALTTQTWGESVKRSFERVGMTVLGGAFGTALYFLLPSDGHWVVLLLLTFIFLTVFLMPLYHLIAVFFLTCFVVFLFALIGAWDWDMLRARIVDTAIGAMIAMMVGFICFPIKTDIRGLFVGYLQKMSALIIMVVDTKPSRSHISGKHLLAEFHTIRKNALSIRYELLFHRLNSVEFSHMLNSIGRCTQLVTNITETFQWIARSLSAEELASVQAAANVAAHNIQVIVQHLQKVSHSKMIAPQSLSTAIEKAIAQNPIHFSSLETHALSYYNLLNFFAQLNFILNDIYMIMVKNSKDECIS